jgi:hypothetical protein
MKLFRRARRLSRRTRRGLVAAITLGLMLSLTGCGAWPDGQIVEVEYGRNGKAVEVREGSGNYEVYLSSDSDCQEDDMLDECATDTDYLVESDGEQSADYRDRNEEEDD